MPRVTSGSQERVLLVVAGPGRSGTSLFSGLTSKFGFAVPQPEVNADWTNPRGFSEPQWAVDFHQGLLDSVQVTVDDGRPEAWDICARVAERPRARRRLAAWLDKQLEESGRILVKDPRLAWFFELYRETAKDIDASLRVVTMLRDPVEVTRSRELAYGTRTTGTTKVASWVNTMLGVEARTRGLPRAFVRYEDLLTDWRSAVTRAWDALDLDLLSDASPEQVAAAGSLVDPLLRRSVTDWRSLEVPERLRGLAERSFRCVDQLAPPPKEDEAVVTGRLDALRAEYLEYYEECAQVARSRTIAARAHERRRLQREFQQRPPHAAPARRIGAAVARRLRRWTGKG
jgi:hypothetical protein